MSYDAFKVAPFARPITVADGDDPRRPRRVVPMPAPSETRCLALAVEAKLVSRKLAADPHLVFELAGELLHLSDEDFAARLRLLQTDEVGRDLLNEMVEQFEMASDDAARSSAILIGLRLRLAAGAFEGGRDVG